MNQELTDVAILINAIWKTANIMGHLPLDQQQEFIQHTWDFILKKLETDQWSKQFLQCPLPPNVSGMQP